MRTIAEITADIERVKAEMQDVHGTTTEVYARIVGYYRSVRNWNRGKREEYNHRKLFIADQDAIHNHLPADSGCDCSSEKAYQDAAQGSMERRVERFELYVRDTCPNCPPVKDECERFPFAGERINVDSEDGFVRASQAGVLSAPTVIFYDADGNETGRAHTVKELRAMPILASSLIAETALA